MTPDTVRRMLEILRELPPSEERDDLIAQGEALLTEVPRPVVWAPESSFDA